MFVALEPRRLYRLVAEQIRLLIESGELTDGQRLPAERDLAERFGVSRPTVREALIVLEVEGHIHIRMGSGVYVSAATARRGKNRPCRTRMAHSKSCRPAASSRARLPRKPRGLRRRNVSQSSMTSSNVWPPRSTVRHRRSISTEPSTPPLPTSSAIRRSIVLPA